MSYSIKKNVSIEIKSQAMKISEIIDLDRKNFTRSHLEKKSCCQSKKSIGFSR